MNSLDILKTAGIVLLMAAAGASIMMIIKHPKEIMGDVKKGLRYIWSHIHKNKDSGKWEIIPSVEQDIELLGEYYMSDNIHKMAQDLTDNKYHMPENTIEEIMKDWKESGIDLPEGSDEEVLTLARMTAKWRLSANTVRVFESLDKLFCAIKDGIETVLVEDEMRKTVDRVTSSTDKRLQPEDVYFNPPTLACDECEDSITMTNTEAADRAVDLMLHGIGGLLGSSITGKPVDNYVRSRRLTNVDEDLEENILDLSDYNKLINLTPDEAIARNIKSSLLTLDMMHKLDKSNFTKYDDIRAKGAPGAKLSKIIGYRGALKEASFRRTREVFVGDSWFPSIAACAIFYDVDRWDIDKRCRGLDGKYVRWSYGALLEPHDPVKKVTA